MPTEISGSPNRGFPLLGLLTLLVFAETWLVLDSAKIIAPNGAWNLVFLGTAMLYCLFAVRWTQKLWRSHWQHLPARGILPETIALLTSFVLAIVGYLFSLGENYGVPLVVLALHSIVYAVIAPITLRRYPGFRTSP